MVSQRVKQRTKTGKKRRFSGNRWTNLTQQASDSHTLPVQSEAAENDGESQEPEPVVVDTEVEPVKETASSSKLIDIPSSSTNKEQPITGNRIIDMEILSEVFSTLNCPSCNNSELQLCELFENKMGLSSNLKLACSCGFIKTFFTSKKHKSKGSGAAGFEINKRIIYALRSCGEGYASLQKITSLLNLPSPMTKKNYKKIHLFFYKHQLFFAQPQLCLMF